MLPLVAIVGRPNVGKSTLFNRLVGQRIALVDDQPGVTRDRREGEARLADLTFRLLDTAGLEDAGIETLAGRMRAQTEAAIAEADAILFVVDGRAGLTPEDRHFANIVRKTGKPVILLANKAEGRRGLEGAYEAFGLGLGDPIPVSAEHGEGLGDLADALAALLPAAIEAEEDFAEDEEEAGDKPAKPIQVAIVGRPNAGKSTLVNALIGEDRLLTSPEAGTTRDSISIDWQWQGRDFRLVDTAGLRKRAKVQDKLEKLSVGDALRAIRFAEVVLVLMDATKPFEDQDLKIADLVIREGRAVVFGFNKWDLVEAKPGAIAKLREELDHWLPQARGAAVVGTSALHAEGLDRLMQAILGAYKVWNKRITTAKLNRWLEAMLEQHSPPAVAGRRIKIRYLTQAKARPPTFVLFGNQLHELPESYMRFLVNGLRDAFDLPGTPIRIERRTGDNPYDKRRG